MNLLAADTKSFKLSLSDEEVKTISKSRMKTYVKKMGKELTLNYIDSLKEKHSKTQKFDSTKLSVAAYLTDNRFSKTERELLFKLRSSTLQVKKNFRIGNIDNNLCEICRLFPCSQEHVLSCPVLTQRCTIVNTATVQHDYIDGNVDKQLLYIKVYSQFWESRQAILEMQ